MIDVDKDPIILGGDTSATCTVVAQLAQQAKVPYLMHVCLADNLTQQGWNYVFRIPPPISQGIGGLTDFLDNVVHPQSVLSGVRELGLRHRHRAGVEELGPIPGLTLQLIVLRAGRP